MNQMRRTVSTEENENIVFLLLEKNQDGEYKYTQRQIEERSSVSRPYIKKVADRYGRSFIKTKDMKKPNFTCMGCGLEKSRSLSRILASKDHFCSRDCRKNWLNKDKKTQEVA